MYTKQMTYNTGVKLTYHNIVDEDHSNVLYRKELAKVFQFDMDTIRDFETLDNKISVLFSKLPKENEVWNTILKKASSTFLVEDERLGFGLLFSYQTFHILHTLLCEYLNTGVMNMEYIENIGNVL